MKKARLLSVVLLILTLAVWALHQFIISLPDWAVRVNGILMLFALAAAAYTAVKRSARS